MSFPRMSYPRTKTKITINPECNTYLYSLSVIPFKSNLIFILYYVLMLIWSWMSTAELEWKAQNVKIIVKVESSNESLSKFHLLCKKLQVFLPKQYCVNVVLKKFCQCYFKSDQKIKWCMVPFPE